MLFWHICDMDMGTFHFTSLVSNIGGVDLDGSGRYVVHTDGVSGMSEFWKIVSELDRTLVWAFRFFALDRSRQPVGELKACKQKYLEIGENPDAWIFWHGSDDQKKLEERRARAGRRAAAKGAPPRRIRRLPRIADASSDEREPDPSGRSSCSSSRPSVELGDSASDGEVAALFDDLFGRESMCSSDELFDEAQPGRGDDLASQASSEMDDEYMVPIEELLGRDSGEDSDTPPALGGPASEAGGELGAAEVPPPPPVEEIYPEIVISESVDGKSHRVNFAFGRLVAYKTTGVCVAECSRPEHGGRCHLTRTLKAGRKVGSGRPLGLLLAWLQDPEIHEASRSRGDWVRPSFAERAAHRLVFQAVPGSEALTAMERVPLDDEGDEPPVVL